MPDSLRIEIFDTNFINRNVFTGLAIERPNRENITRFVLGDSGVVTAQRISEIKSEIRICGSNLRDPVAGVLSDVDDLPSFLVMEVQESSATLVEQARVIQARLDSRRRLASDLTAAIARPELELYSVPSSIDDLVNKIQSVLSSTFEQAHQVAEARLMEHIQEHMQNSLNSRSWLQQGLALTKDEECPFCGQPIVGSAVELIRAYQAMFDTAFERYVSEVELAIEDVQNEFSSAFYNDLQHCVDRNQLAFLEYPELLVDNDIRGSIDCARAISVELTRLNEQWNAIHSNSLVELTNPGTSVT